MNAYTKQRLGITEKKSDALWVPAKEIMTLTGWDAQYMHRARKYGFIEWKGDRKTGMFYNMKSIPQELIKKAS